MAKMGKEIYVTTPNKVGVLAKVTGAIAEEGVNILAISTWTEGNNGYFRIVAENNDKAKAGLTKLGYTFKEDEIIMVDLTDKPGGAHSQLQKIANAGINTNWFWAATGYSNKTLAILNTNDNNKALKLLA